MTKTRFRTLILIYVAFELATIMVPLIPNLYSQELAFAYNTEPENWLTSNPWMVFSIATPLLVLGIAGILGLYLFKSWGRTLSIYTTLVTAILFLFFGPTLESAVESSFSYVSTLLWGAILGIAYYSPLSSSFVKVPRNEL